MRIPNVYYISNSHCKKIDLIPNIKSLSYTMALTGTLFQEWSFQCRNTSQLIDRITTEVIRFNADAMFVMSANGIEYMLFGKISETPYGEIMCRILENINALIN